MSRAATVEIHKEELTFSAGHFMIFSDTRRESLHGHDYHVHAAFDCTVGDNGMSFDCRDYKHRLLALCQTLDYRFILPSKSPYLTFQDGGDRWFISVAQDDLVFLKKDTVVLDIANATLEELSNWFLQQLLLNPTELAEHKIHGITLRVFNTRGESGGTSWKAG